MEPTVSARRIRAIQNRLTAIRGERWYWLLGFCVLSVCIHLLLMFRSGPFIRPAASPGPHEVEVTLTTWHAPKSRSVSTLLKPSDPNTRQRPGVSAAQHRVASRLEHRDRAPVPVNRQSAGPGGLDPRREAKPILLGISPFQAAEHAGVTSNADALPLSGT